MTSISADLHKFGYAPKGASVLLQRGRDRQRAQYFATTGWPGYPVVNPTMLGSKSAGALAASWAIVQALGARGFAELAESCRRATRALADIIGDIEGLRIVGEPVGPLLAVATDESVPEDRRVDPHHWADRARRRGWLLQLQPGLDPGGRNASAAHDASDDHSGDGRAGRRTRGGAPRIRRRCARRAGGRRDGAVLGALPAGAWRTGPLDSESAAGILEAIGLAGDSDDPSGARLPSEMAPFLALIEALPHAAHGAAAGRADRAHRGAAVALSGGRRPT